MLLPLMSPPTTRISCELGLDDEMFRHYDKFSIMKFQDVQQLVSFHLLQILLKLKG